MERHSKVSDEREEEGWRRVARMIPDAAAWRDAGFFPGEAADWYVSGFTLAEAIGFRDNGYDPDNVRNAEDARLVRLEEDGSDEIHM